MLHSPKMNELVSYQNSTHTTPFSCRCGHIKMASQQGVLDEKGTELIASYKAIAAKLKKRFMKKPNVKAASVEYGKLANSLKNEENNEYAALCFMAMAKCDQLTADSGSEAESWANAGRQFILAEEKLMAARNVSYNDMLEAGIHSFLLAVHVLEVQGDNLLAASFALEAGQRLMKCEWYSQAAIFLQRAVDLQSQTIDWRIDTLGKLVSCRLQLRDYSSALGILSQIVSESNGKDGPYEQLINSCSISQLLILLLLKPNRRHLSAQLAAVWDSYSKLPSLDDLNDKRLLLHALTVAVNEKDYSSVKDISIKLRPLLTSDQKLLLHTVLEEYSYHHSLH
ncbi:PREDICTED: factor VIII intron 22 protein-like [Amphimedon queenslandica]|uniref:Factor VIII intron 22 protein n=1 Tax=Amphimedon queenslandica TaxID=400682 RepID=A0AAN0J2T9_AMPQE|nr:PREDICTED: factor VIII intron 22 protein-like [Amphimedon queenslandica]|eukprot:XP_019851053.1 PREDICTED: factor VIII intron 22 protein-like [Amphimedon queenslandica]